MLEAARRACGLDADGAAAVEIGLSRVAALAMVGNYAEAERELERVKGELSSALKGAREALTAPDRRGKRQK
jgi:Flp pilus assembly pilin Flp